MPQFSKSSKDRLATCDHRLQEVMNHVITKFDVSILCGVRGKEDQEEAFKNGFTKVHYPNSRHNKTPSQAVDALTCPVTWEDLKGLTPDELRRAYVLASQAHVAGYIRGYAAAKGIDITWGGDWNRNGKLETIEFMDIPHYQVEG